MKIKTNESHKAEWTYINCSANLNLYEGKLITYRESKKYGYRYDIIQLNDKFYLTQALYTVINNRESISVHEIKSINDAKAIMEAMIQFNKSYRAKPHEVDA